MSLESVTMISNDPRGAPVFEVGYQLPGQMNRKRTFTLEVHPEQDVHRQMEHYHLVEGGTDLTSGFVP